MNYEFINFEITNQVALITLNRPDEANSIHEPLVKELDDISMRCHRDSGVRAAILTGSGKMFCGGGDLKAFIDQGDEVSNYVDQTATILHHAISRFSKMSAPLIMAVNGVAAGAGASIALACDIVVAKESATFLQAFSKI